MCTVRATVHLKAWQTDHTSLNMGKQRLQQGQMDMAHQTHICVCLKMFDWCAMGLGQIIKWVVRCNYLLRNAQKVF